ncbi:MAG: HAD-IA family hydrolase [Propionibacteriaceae bacterium]|jgi:putative hydrolase of the HAD superfamily|nr:HAD-IA family hydrolase [Propionibacteriaceae bacterium]
MNRAVVFDLGSVLADPAPLYPRIGRILGVAPELVAEVVWIHRRPYDQGLPDLDYWRRTLDELDLTVDLNDCLPHLVKADLATWSVIRPAAHAILTELRQGGVPTAILSNAPLSFARAADGFAYSGLIDQAFYSAELGLAKPDPAIYHHVETALGRSADQLWFVDDRSENVEAAADLGWHVHQWVDDADTRAWLTEAGFLAS